MSNTLKPSSPKIRVLCPLEKHSRCRCSGSFVHVVKVPYIQAPRRLVKARNYS